jgi:FKBP-type peptidyl-prolyl cis-trans isomerase 2
VVFVRSLAAISVAAAALLQGAAAARAEEPARPVVADGRKVSIEYTLELEDGTTADTNVGTAPLVYEHGAFELMAGLEKALAGMAVGESKQGTLAPEEAYGEVDPELFQEVETSRIPEQDRRAGANLFYRDETGDRQLVRVHEVRGDRTVIDFNHPLAGHEIRYSVKVVKIE